MKVKELIEALNEVPQELEVVMSKDPEGNGFRKFSGDFSFCNFKDEDNIFHEEDILDHSIPSEEMNAVILWP